jgi:hypothetical protein
VVFNPEALTDTLIFKASSADVVMLLEDAAVLESGGQVQEFVPIDGFIMAIDTSMFIAAIAGTAPGEVEGVGAADAHRMLQRADSLTSQSVRGHVFAMHYERQHARGLGTVVVTVSRERRCALQYCCCCCCCCCGGGGGGGGGGSTAVMCQ